MSHTTPPDDARAAAPTYPATALQDCEVCGGMGAMTARAADKPDALPAVIPCPACGGKGTTLRAFPPKLAVVRDV